MMDREIKLRFWLPEEEMHYSENMDNYYIGSWIVKDSIIKMQYTGLTDQEGTEIYEGDVIEDDYIATSEYRSQVYFQNGAFWVNYGGAVKLLADRDMRHIKVIGNKFEDEELLDDNG